MDAKQVSNRGEHLCAGNARLVCAEVPVKDSGAVVELGNLGYSSAAAVTRNIFVPAQIVSFHPGALVLAKFSEYETSSASMNVVHLWMDVRCSKDGAQESYPSLLRNRRVWESDAT